MLNYQKAYPKYDRFVDHAQQIVHVDESELKNHTFPWPRPILIGGYGWVNMCLDGMMTMET